MALMLAQEASAGLSAASMALRWMPFDQKSGPPISTMTLVSRLPASTKASRRRRQSAVDMAPLWKSKCRKPTPPSSS
jgi:hypothetical protein